jgi:hypothetical protein
MFALVITTSTLLLAHPAASQKAGGGKGGLAGLGALLGGTLPGGFELPNMTGPMFPADYLSLPGTGRYPAVRYGIRQSLNGSDLPLALVCGA